MKDEGVVVVVERRRRKKRKEGRGKNEGHEVKLPPKDPGPSSTTTPQAKWSEVRGQEKRTLRPQARREVEETGSRQEERSMKRR